MFCQYELTLFLRFFALPMYKMAVSFLNIYTPGDVEILLMSGNILTFLLNFSILLINKPERGVLAMKSRILDALRRLFRRSLVPRQRTTVAEEVFRGLERQRIQARMRHLREQASVGSSR